MLEVLRTLRRYELAGSLDVRSASVFAVEVRQAQVRYWPPDRSTSLPHRAHGEVTIEVRALLRTRHPGASSR